MGMHFRHRFSYSIIVSVLAMVIALGGTAWAALTVTGRNIKDGTLKSVDIKNGSLSASTVALSSRTAMKAKGPTGDTGSKGTTGPVGNTGAVGATGTPAKNAYAWSYHVEDTLLKDPSTENSAPAKDWWETGWNQAGTGDWTIVGAGFQGVKIELASDKNDGLLVLETDSDVIVMAHVTAWHQDASVHSRLECRLRITDNSTNAQSTVGQPVMVSTQQELHVVTVPLIGGIRRGPGTYGVKTECRDLDWNGAGYGQWFVLKGNVSVLSAKNWR